MVTREVFLGGQRRQLEPKYSHRLFSRLPGPRRPVLEPLGTMFETPLIPWTVILVVPMRRLGPI
jgi:hypothetical protein